MIWANLLSFVCALIVSIVLSYTLNPRKYRWLINLCSFVLGCLLILVGVLYVTISSGLALM